MIYLKGFKRINAMQQTGKTAGRRDVPNAIAIAMAILGLAGAGGGWAADEHTVALWLFDEPMYLNQAFYDASTNWYNLNLQPRLNPGSASWQTDHNASVVTGRFGNAIARQSSSGVAADTRLDMAFPYQSDWTWEFWLRATNAPSGTAYVFDTTNVWERCSLESGGTSWRLVCKNTGLDAIVSAGSGLFDSAWHHIAFVYQGGGTTVTYFVDGTQRVQQAVAVSSATSATAGRLTLLSRYDGTSPLQASLDEFRISSVGRYAANFTPATLSRNFGSSPPTPSAPTGPAPISFQGVVDLQAHKHLFIDGILFEAGGEGLVLRAHPPSPSTYQICTIVTNGGSGPFMRDLPQERWANGTVIWNDGVFLDYDGKVRYYFANQNEASGDSTYNSYWSLATSDDGLTFSRPNLGLVAYQGSTSNNILFRGRQGTVILDGNPGADPWALFKFAGWEYHSGTVAMSSSNGIHWTRNEVQQTPFDTAGHVEHFWDDQTGTYKCYLRGESFWSTSPAPANGGTGREALLAETTNFFNPWPFQPIPYPSWRDFPQQRTLPTPSLELPKAFITEYWPEVGFTIHPYRTVSHKYAGAPDAYVSFTWRFYQVAGVDQGRNVGLSTSRDGKTWTNWKLPWYIPANQTFNGVAMKEALSINGLLHREGELWQYGALKNAVHNNSSANDRLIRMKQRVDGFVSLSADAVAGEAITRELRFAGTNLSLNVRVRSGGSVGIALLNADGSARAGYGLADCDPIQGDFLRKAVTWNGAAHIATSATARLKIRLQNADLYALQFTNQVVQLTNLVSHQDGLSLPLSSSMSMPEAPVITTQPADIAVYASQSAAFSVTATGNATQVYQWYTNDAAIAGATGTTYTTPATTTNDSGTQFKVTVTNAFGAVTSSVATLTVNPLPVGTVVATGGTVTNYTLNGLSYRAHIFTTVGATNLNVLVGGDVEVLVVAGGGAGGRGDNGNGAGGGGGAGGLIYTNIAVVVSNYAVMVGTGGSTNTTAPGSNSLFGSLTALGGGYGGRVVGLVATNGGSGGGGFGRDGLTSAGSATQPGSSSGGYGSGGGVGGGTGGGGGGGGGAGSAGVAGGSGSYGGNGGAGFANSISGVSTVYAGGGGGGSGASGQAAGTATGGGGAGGAYGQNNGASALANTGGGGGGGAEVLNAGTETWGGTGGSGIVIVRYVTGGGTSTNAQSPVITTNPANISVTAGQSAAFSVTASGTAPLSYQWCKNAAPIGGATASSYTTPATTTNDSGAAFNVIVTNAYGAVTSSVAVLTVNPAPTGGVSATGGTVTNYVENGTNFTAHVFTNTAPTNLQVTVGGNVAVLIVAGGGGGGGGGGSDTRGGGGGAGGLIATNVQVSSGSNYTITVGGGGFGGPGNSNGGQGTNSVALGFTAAGGGYGSCNRNVNGGDGGSGGGVGASLNAGTALPGNPTAGQGYAGGTNESAAQNAGGGGGAGSAGQNGGASAGLGGSGKTNSFSGAPVEYARGGNGRRAAEGGGNGTNGAPNTGNGGNGAGPNELGPGYSNIGGKGGSGIVIVRYVTGGSDPYQTWRATHFTTEQLADTNTSGDTADPDHDGLNNQQEYWAGTNPTNALSCLILYAPTNNIAAEGKFVVRWQSVSNKVYTVQATTNLLSAFTNVVTNLPATPTVNLHTDSVGSAETKFYRVKLE